MSMRSFSESASMAIVSFFEAAAKAHEAMFAAWGYIEGCGSEEAPKVTINEISVPDFVDKDEL